VIYVPGVVDRDPGIRVHERVDQRLWTVLGRDTAPNLERHTVLEANRGSRQRRRWRAQPGGGRPADGCPDHLSPVEVERLERFHRCTPRHVSLQTAWDPRVAMRRSFHQAYARTSTMRAVAPPWVESTVTRRAPVVVAGKE